MSSEALRRTESAQARAADPGASAWVRANAGTGKTHVLVARVLRLLLDGAPPEGIVCLTFTKAAAAEMANRLARELGEWAVLPPDALSGRLERLLARAPSPEEMLAARRLFAAVLDTPGGLRIQTIHGFCERILRQFPLEADVAPGFSVMAEADSRSRLRAATAYVLDEAGARAGDAAGSVAGDGRSPCRGGAVRDASGGGAARARDAVRHDCGGRRRRVPSRRLDRAGAWRAGGCHPRSCRSGAGRGAQRCADRRYRAGTGSRIAHEGCGHRRGAAHGGLRRERRRASRSDARGVSHAKRRGQKG